MKPAESPHFSRIFTAPPIVFASKIILWVSLIIFLSINILGRKFTGPYWNKHITILIKPTSSTAHLTLARELWHIGDWQKARDELLITQTLPQVLGATTSPIDLLREWTEEPARLAKELQFWQTIIKEKPDYRDAYLQASALSYQLNRSENARQYLDQAVSLDPNFPIASRLAQLLSSR